MLTEAEVHRRLTRGEWKTPYEIKSEIDSDSGIKYPALYGIPLAPICIYLKELASKGYARRRERKNGNNRKRIPLQEYRLTPNGEKRQQEMRL